MTLERIVFHMIQFPPAFDRHPLHRVLGVSFVLRTDWPRDKDTKRLG